MEGTSPGGATPEGEVRTGDDTAVAGVDAADAAGSRPIIVGIGASAGGLEAIQAFFESIPEHTGAAFVLVQHLSPDFKSLMGEILARYTKMEAVQIEDSVEISPDKVYLLPPRATVNIDGSRLQVVQQSEEHGPRYPINAFFESLADECNGECIAVVLSGTGTDGAIGARSVRASGGVVMVQDSATALFNGMPNATLATGTTDFTANPRDLAARVTELLLTDSLRLRDRAGIPIADSSAEYVSLIRAVERDAGLDLSAYKPGTIKRRIWRRMAMSKQTLLVDYLERIQSDPEECQALARDCLIHVTRFFRDPEAFEELRKALHRLVVGRNVSERPLRVWDVGCSTGEETYSIAILLERIIHETGAKIDFKIFATDLDQQAASTTSNGRYPSSAAAGLTKELAGAFAFEADEIVVEPSIRRRIVVARHNILSDPPFPRADLVVCRNLLIYLQPEAQRAALERIDFSLAPGGILMLGPSEVLDESVGRYTTLSTRWRVFEKSKEALPRVPTFVASREIERGPPRLAPMKQRAPSLNNHDAVRAAELLVSRYAICAIVVDGQGNLIYSFGEVDQILKVRRGHASNRIDDLLPRELSLSVRHGMRVAIGSDEPVAFLGLSSGGHAGTIDLEVARLPNSDRDAPDTFAISVRRGSAIPDGTTVLEGSDEKTNISGVRISALEQELHATRESLQSTIEELETTNEELQTVNEELLSANEELQSTNEELHSVNEELYTVNAEHQAKNAELANVSYDLENFLGATRIGLIFADQALRVRRFTPDVRLAFPLREVDIGRQLTEISGSIDVDIARIGAEVIRSGEPYEQSLTNSEGIPLLIAVRPHDDRRRGFVGCVISVIDLTYHVWTLQGDKAARALTHAIEDVEGEVYIVRDMDSGRFIYLSSSFVGIWGRSIQECLDDEAIWIDSVHPDDIERVELGLDAGADDSRGPIDFRIVRPDGEVRWIRLRSLGVHTSEGGEELACSVATDRTERIKAVSEVRARGDLMREALDRTSERILILRDGDRILWANERAREQIRQASGIPRQLRSVLADTDSRRSLSQTLESKAIADGERMSLELAIEGAEGRSTVAAMSMVRIGGDDTGVGDDIGAILCRW